MPDTLQRTNQQSSPEGATNPWRNEPTLREVIVLWASSALVFVISVSSFENYSQLVRNFGDTSAYLQISDAIRSWSFSGLQLKHFWGLPYAVAVLARLTFISTQSALLIVCATSSLAAVILAYRLWGGWIALFFALLNFDWLQRSFLGGSEPLFVALLFGSFLAIRKESWKWAALLASLATITRPLGVLLLIGIGVTLLVRRNWRELVFAIAIAATIALLYVTPLRIYLHDPLGTVHSYGVLQSSNPYPPLFGIPFRAIILVTLRDRPPASNLILTLSWIFLVLAGNVAALTSSEFRAYSKSHLPEIIFAAPYLLSVYCYNSPAFARGNFARFAIPILPFIYLALYRWLPKDRRVLWALSILSPVFAAASAIGLKNVIAAIQAH